MYQKLIFNFSKDGSYKEVENDDLNERDDDEVITILH